MDSIIPTVDTIAAISSAIALGKGGIAVIRVSGSKAIEICQTIVKTKSSHAWQSHRIFYGFIQEPQEKKLIDEVLILVMKSPKSFTGENTVEIHCHGGIVIVNRILEIILTIPQVRLANPGEFSQRAFLNGKIDLTQAESINEIINCKNLRAAELAFKGVQGEVKNKINQLKNELIDQLAEIEARVDFEEDFGEFNYSNFSTNLNKIKEKIKELIENSKRNDYLHNGISIALIGKTNAGKSSLLNMLAKQKKAIVTDIPGTTRDIIEVNLTIENIPIRIIDTAGIRYSDDVIENIGISKSFEMIREADYIIYIFDIQKGLDKEDKKIIKKIPVEKLITIVGNKIDLLKEKQINKSKQKTFISIKKELGDLLLHIIFYAKIGSEKKVFDITDIANQISEKLIRRHPHIYGNLKAYDADQVSSNWEIIKLNEGKKSLLEGVPKTLPALVKAYRVQEKASSVGFDWDDMDGVLNKVEEELEELRIELSKKKIDNIESEFGDLLFSLINYARFLKINPENALEKTNKKFMKRFKYIESGANKVGKKINELSKEEFDFFWQKAKSN